VRSGRRGFSGELRQAGAVHHLELMPGTVAVIDIAP
jgi:hypothetical protein